MRARELERLSDLLMQWSEAHTQESMLRDAVAELRHHIAGELDERDGVA